MDVAIGFDSHKETIAGGCVDEMGRVVALEQFINTHPGTSGSWCGSAASLGGW